MTSDHVREVIAVVGKRRAQVSSDREVPRLALPPRERLVGHLPKQILSEPVIAHLRRQPICGHAQHLTAEQLTQSGSHLVLALARDSDERLRREAAAQHRRIGDEQAQMLVECIEP